MPAGLVCAFSLAMVTRCMYRMLTTTTTAAASSTTTDNSNWTQINNWKKKIWSVCHFLSVNSIFFQITWKISCSQPIWTHHIITTTRTLIVTSLFFSFHLSQSETDSHFHLLEINFFLFHPISYPFDIRILSSNCLPHTVFSCLHKIWTQPNFANEIGKKFCSAIKELKCGIQILVYLSFSVMKYCFLFVNCLCVIKYTLGYTSQTWIKNYVQFMYNSK